MKAWLITATAAMIASASCSDGTGGGESEPKAAATVTATATVTETITASPSPDQTSGGADTLALGEQWKGEVTTSTVLEHRRNVPGYGVDAGERWDAVLVKTCVLPAAGEGVTMSWSPWSLTDSSGGLYPASSSTYENFPVPEYPFADSSVFRSGDCARGWIVFGVPAEQGVSGVRYGNQAGETVTWRLR